MLRSLRSGANQLSGLSAALLKMAELGPDRLSISQGALFLFVGLADLSGKPATFSDLREDLGPALLKSLHTTYRVFLTDDEREPDRSTSLGWIYRQTDPADNRRKYLRLTPRGCEVLQAVLSAMGGDAVARDNNDRR